MKTEYTMLFRPGLGVPHYYVGTKKNRKTARYEKRPGNSQENNAKEKDND